MLGEGTFGETWKAVNLNTGEFVAIKAYKDKDDMMYTINKFVEEYTALEDLTKVSKLCTDYAICYKDHYYFNRMPRLVMELVNGNSLTKVISNSDLDVRRKDFSLLHDLVLGLDELHKVGLITHQDIKEDNIMFDNKANKFKFIDWGAGCLKSKYCDVRDYCYEPCGYIGTEYTTPPEIYNNYIITNNIYDRQTFDETRAHDIWSIGVVLYDWFMFEGKSWYNQYIKYHHGKYLSTMPIKIIHNVIDSFGLPDVVSNILKLMLNKKEIRLDNWDNIVNMVETWKDNLLNYQNQQQSLLMIVLLRLIWEKEEIIV